MKFRNDREPLDIQMTDDEVNQLRNLRLPKALRETFAGNASDITGRTRQFDVATRILRKETEWKKAVLDAVAVDQALERMDGELTDLAEVRNQLAAAKRDRDAAIEAEQVLRRQLEVETAKPALAIHARGTSR